MKGRQDDTVRGGGGLGYKNLGITSGQTDCLYGKETWI